MIVSDDRSLALVLGFLACRRAASYLHDHQLDYLVVVMCSGVTVGAIWEVVVWFIVMGDFADSPVSDIVWDWLGVLAAAPSGL